MGNGEEACGGLSLFCWGSGQFGQHGHAIEDAIPFLEGHVKRFEGRAKLVSCGASHTIVVTDSNEVFAWGNGQNGQLGSGSVRQLLSPTRMKLKIDGQVNVTGVSCGDRHTCLLLQDGRVLCCGSNFYAQLTYDLMEPQYRRDLLLPTVMTLAHRVLQIACGQHHTILLCEGGEVACIGRNMYGQIGVPSEDSRNDCFEKPKVLTGAFGAVAIEKIAAGGNHCLCIDRDGQAFCWGYGRACGLRQGHVMSPVRLNATRPVIGADGGGSHSVLLTDEGQLLAIGSNSDGQCGFSSDTHFLSSLRPLPSSDLLGAVSAFACGETFTVVAAAHGVFAWGKHSHVISTEDIGARCFGLAGLAGPGCSVRALAAGTWHAAALLEGCPEPPPTAPPLPPPTAAATTHPPSPDGIGLRRERTRITLAELYGPTPTPTACNGYSDDEEEKKMDTLGGTKGAEEGEEEEKKIERFKEEEEEEKKMEKFKEEKEEEDEMKEEDKELFSSAPTPASSSSSLPSASSPSRSPFSSPSPSPLPPAPSLPPRAPGPPRPPPNKAFRRAARAPLQVTAGNRSLSEDVFLLPARAAAPAIRRQTAELQRPALGRREPPGLVRERSLMMPRTLTFVLNERKEAVTAENSRDQRPAEGRSASIRPMLRRAVTTLSRAPET